MTNITNKHLKKKSSLKGFKIANKESIGFVNNIKTKRKVKLKEAL
jgi:hypothetical protein